VNSAIGGGGAAVKPALSGRRATLAAKSLDANQGRAFFPIDENYFPKLLPLVGQPVGRRFNIA
jgi:hypothetical protein